MKIENLNRANDLCAMKNTALKLLEENNRALSFMKKYRWDSGFYPFAFDMTYQASSCCDKNTKFAKRITLRGSSHMISEIYCTIPLDLLIQAVQGEIDRLTNRLEEIEKEVEKL